jgi:hypothetical protein
MRFAIIAVFLGLAGCAQSVQYPPTGKGWVRLNDARAARMGTQLAGSPSYNQADFKVIIDPVYGTRICDGARSFRLDFDGRWRIWDAWPWVGPRGGIGGGRVIIYLSDGSSAYYRFYHGSIDLHGGRPDVTIAAACYDPSGYYAALQNEPHNPMTAQLTFR